MDAEADAEAEADTEADADADAEALASVAPGIATVTVRATVHVVCDVKSVCHGSTVRGIESAHLPQITEETRLRGRTDRSACSGRRAWP